MAALTLGSVIAALYVMPGRWHTNDRQAEPREYTLTSLYPRVSSVNWAVNRYFRKTLHARHPTEEA